MRVGPLVRGALAFAFGLAVAGAAMAQAPAAAASAASAASAPAGPTVRAVLVAPLQAARQALADNKPDESLRQLLAAEAVPDRTAYENYVIERIRIIALRQTKDAAGMLRAIDAALATGQAEPDVRRALLEEAVIASALTLKDQPAVERWAARYFEAGGTSGDVRLLQAQSFYLQGKHADAARALEQLAGQQRAAGQPPREAQLRLQAGNFDKLGDEAGYVRSLEQLIALSPKAEFWGSLLQRVSARPGFDARLRIDLLRLGTTIKVYDQAGPWVELAERALQDGFAIEAQQVLAAGTAAGILGQAQGDLRARAIRLADADRRNAGAPPDARAAAGMSAQALFNAGWNLFTADQREAGTALMQQAVAKGLADPTPIARLRLGAAYARMGDVARARELLQPIADAADASGTSALARAWLLTLAR